MNYSEVYLQMLEKFKAISMEDIVTIGIPVDIVASEARTLHFWSTNDKDILISKGMKAESIDDLLNASDALLTAESIWKNEIESGDTYSQEWKQKSPAAFDLREELIHIYKYAFRNEPNLLKLVAEIQDGISNSNLIEDLHGLCLIGQKNSSLLTPVNADISLVTKAGTMATEMGNLLAKANSERNSTSESKINRDKAYTFVKRLTEEVRECGKFAFWKDETRLKGYRSDYSRKLYLKRKNNSATATTQE
ncbi:MAG: hypothetical protein JXA53_01875 [Bacteroidales bacterium]|nr:hypothetical protein [Bacteroidales bacterium]